MTIVNIHEAKTHLSRLVDRAAQGEPFVIAKAGKPMVRVTAIETPVAPQRLGFLEGEIRVPEDFDRMGAESIAAMFTGEAATGASGDDAHAPETDRPRRTRRKRRTP